MLRIRHITPFSRRAALAAALVVLCSGVRGEPADEPSRQATEPELKAVLLFHLTQYVTWPAVLTNGPGAFLIGILGPDPIGPALDKVVENEKVGTRPIRVVRAQNLRDLPPCELVYVSPEYRQPLGRTLATLHQRPAFTVGESDDFIEQGGIVRFKRAANQKIKLAISLERARRHGFNVSAQLLRVAEVITTSAVP